MNVLAIRQVKKGTETTGFRIGTRVNMLALDLILSDVLKMLVLIVQGKLFNRQGMDQSGSH